MSEVFYYCIDNRELNYIIYRCLKTGKMWHLMNSYLRTIHLVHHAEIETFQWNMVTGRETCEAYVGPASPVLQDLLLPLFTPGSLEIEGEFREWEYLKYLFNRIRGKRKVDEDFIDDYLYYLGQNLRTIADKAYCRWYTAGSGIRNIPEFFPELEYLFTPFINDFPDLKNAIPCDMNTEEFFEYDPAHTISYVPSQNITTLKQETERRRRHLLSHLANSGWINEQDAANIALPLMRDILDFARREKRGILMVVD